MHAEPLRLSAPAKVNLALHVTGQRADGYHLLDSLVLFASDGDTITLAPAPEYGLTVTGPRAEGVPVDDGNLCLRAARMMGQPVAITLDKHLPAAAGLGGGSADAAAVLQGIHALTGAPLPDQPETLGADIPVCLRGRATRMRGVGEQLEDLPSLPPLPAVLVNPGIEVPTPAVFRALEQRDNPGMEPLPEGLSTPQALIPWLARQRNDLEPPALRVAPGIAPVLGALRDAPDCLLARMSGSGASCFGLFPDMQTAEAAAQAIAAARPGWWVRATQLR